MRPTSYMVFAAALALTVLACSPTSHANGGSRHDLYVVERGPGSVSDSSASAVADAVAEAQGGSAVAESGDSSANLSVGDIGTGDVSVNGGDVNVRSVRGAPAIGLGGSDSTAPLLKCFGLGASAATGGGAGGGTGFWCWIVRPMWFDQQAEELAAMGLKEQAARAKCHERLQWAVFGSQEQCEAVIHQHLIDVEIAANLDDMDTLNALDRSLRANTLLAQVSEEEVKALRERLATLEKEMADSAERTIMLGREVQASKQSEPEPESDPRLEAIQQRVREIPRIELPAAKEKSDG